MYFAVAFWLVVRAIMIRPSWEAGYCFFAAVVLVGMAIGAWADDKA
jgi:hypothetical protein